MSKKLITAIALAAIGATGAYAEVGRTLTQQGYSLTNIYSIAQTATLGGTSRGGAGVNDLFVINENMGALRVYNESGLLKTITLPDGYHLWTSSNTDDAGHILVRVDKVKTTFDGVPSIDGNHGFLVFDTNTGELIDDMFVPLTPPSGQTAKRFDATGHVQGNIVNGMDVRVYIPVGNGTASGGDVTNIYTYEDGNITVHVPSPYSFASLPDAELFTSSNLKVQRSTGMCMQYNEGGALYVADFPNPHVDDSRSKAGGFGNAIAQYATEEFVVTDKNGNSKTKLNVTPTGKYFYTPTHSGMAGFCIFNIQGVDYIVYPHATANDSNSGDALAISKVSYVDTPATNMGMEGETIVNDKLAGPLVAVARPAVSSTGKYMYPGNVTGACTYTIEPVEGDANSVYIYAYGMEAPANKWKFTVPAPIETGVADIEASDADAPVEFYNLQGMPVAEPADGVYIRRQGGKAAKVFVK